MRKRKIIVLYEDGSYRKISENKFHYDISMEYLLIPDMYIEDHEMYIPVVANMFMDFTKAHIKLWNAFFNLNYEDEDMNSLEHFQTVDEEYTSLIDVINILHSLTRMDYVGELFGTTIDASCYITSIRCYYVLVELYNANGEKILNIEHRESTKLSSKHLRVTNASIINKLKKFIQYLPNSSTFGQHFLILKKNHTWVYEKMMHFRDYPKDSIAGIYFGTMRTIYLTDFVDVVLANTINFTVDGDFIMFDDMDWDGCGDTAKEIEDIYESDSYLQSFGLVVNDGFALMEFYMYLPYVFMESFVIAKYFIYSDYQKGIALVTRLAFNNSAQSIVSFNCDNLPTFKEIWELTIAMSEIDIQEKIIL